MYEPNFRQQFVAVEVTQLVIQFTHVQLNDESLAAMGQKKAGLSEVLDPDTIMCLGESGRLESAGGESMSEVKNGGPQRRNGGVDRCTGIEEVQLAFWGNLERNQKLDGFVIWGAG